MKGGEDMGKTGRPKRTKTAVLHVAIDAEVLSAFKQRVGPGQILCRVVERILAAWTKGGARC